MGVIPKFILDQFWISFAVHVIETLGNIATGKELCPKSFPAMINDSVQTFEIEQLPMNPLDMQPPKQLKYTPVQYITGR